MGPEADPLLVPPDLVPDAADPASPLLSITYVSSSSGLFDVAQLRDMLEEWRVVNHGRGLTGMLLYSGGNIIQTLEGPRDAVESTFAAIKADPRHTGVLTLFSEVTTSRAFPDWSMGFRHLSRDEVRDVDGFNDFLQQPAGQDLGEGATSAHHLMKVFKDTMR